MTTPTNHHTENTVRDREVVVTNGSGSSFGSAIVAVVAVIVLAVLGYFLIGAIGAADGGAEAGSDGGTAELDVTVDGADSGGGEG